MILPNSNLSLFLFCRIHIHKIRHQRWPFHWRQCHHLGLPLAPPLESCRFYSRTIWVRDVILFRLSEATGQQIVMTGLIDLLCLRPNEWAKTWLCVSCILKLEIFGMVYNDFRILGLRSIGPTRAFGSRVQWTQQNYYILKKDFDFWKKNKFKDHENMVFSWNYGLHVTLVNFVWLHVFMLSEYSCEQLDLFFGSRSLPT